MGCAALHVEAAPATGSADGLVLLQTSKAVHRMTHAESAAATALTQAAALGSVAQPSNATASNATGRNATGPLPWSLTFHCHQLMLHGSKLGSFILWYFFAWFFWSGLILYVFLPAWICLRSASKEERDRDDCLKAGMRMTCCAFTTGQVFSTCMLALYILGLQGRLEFSHIPKNAGTTVEASGLRGGINWGHEDSLLVGYTTMPDGNTCRSYHVPPHMLDQARPGWRGWLFNPYLGARIFCVTRHPYSRIVSEYEYLLMDSTYWGHEFAEEYHNGVFDYPACTVEGLNHFVERTMTQYLNGSFYLDDCHHIPQADYIWDPDGAQRCSHVLRTDGLPGNFDELMRSHGYNVYLDEASNAQSSCTNLTEDALSSRSRSLLQQVYARDFQLLGYEPY